jgi:hypothetical protein
MVEKLARNRRLYAGLMDRAQKAIGRWRLPDLVGRD